MLETSLEKLAEHGIVGLVCAVLLAGLVWIFRRYDASQERRAADALGWQKALADNTEVLRELRDAYRAETAVIAALGEANRNQTRAIDALTSQRRPR